MPAKLALYMRVSSEEQKTKETIGTQDQFLREYVALYGLEVVKVYKDEAISGTVPLGERPAGRSCSLTRRAASSTRCSSTGSTGSGARCSWWSTRTTAWSRPASS